MASSVLNTGAVKEARSRAEEFGDLAVYSMQTIRTIPSAFRYTSEVLRQLSILIRGSSFLIFSMVAFLAYGATNFGYYFLKSAGAADYVGLVAGAGGPRLLAPLSFGYAFAAKVGCGITSEVGAMKISEELDAYEAEGISARTYVVGTRAAAALLYIPMALAFGLIGNQVGAYFDAVTLLHAVPASTFFHSDWSNQALTDQVFAFGVMAVIAGAIVLVAAYYGSSTSGGPDQVGSAVARSLRINLVLVHVILGVAMFGVYGAGANLGLPIGG